MSSVLSKITTPFGLLDPIVQEQLRLHGGPYEFFNGNGWRAAVLAPDEWLNFQTYRVKPGPKVEKITMAVFIDREGYVQPSYINGKTTRVSVAFDRIDGVIDLPSYRVFPR